MKPKNLQILTDEELVAKIVETNNTQLFAVLYDRYSSVVYNKCYGFASTKVEAEDLTHDVFIRLFVKLRTFKGKSRFSTWLYAFTYNFCVNYVQRNTHKKQEKRIVSSDEVKENDSYDATEDSELLSLKTDQLGKALEMIDPKDKVILLMKYQDDMPIKEMSIYLDISESAVKMRLKRAKEKVVLICKTM